MNETTTNHASNEEFIATVREEWERRTLLDFLRIEIGRRETESTRPGWTSWALFAAVAALVSYLLAAIELGGLNWQTIGILFVLLSIGVDCLQFSTTFLQENPEDSESQRRFHFTNVVATESRLSALVMLLRLLVVYGVYNSVECRLHQVCHMSLVAFLGLSIMLSAGLLLVSWFRLPIPKSRRPKHWWDRPLGFVLWIGAGIVAFVGILAKLNELSPAIRDWRVAGTLVAISLVVLFLSQVRQAPALLEDLKGLERRLALGQLTVTEAREKTDRILQGLTLGDIMEPYVRRALHDLDSYESENKKYAAAVDALRAEAGDFSPEHLRKQDATIMTLVRGIRGIMGDVDAKLNCCKKSIGSLRMQESFLTGMAPHLADEMKTLKSGVDSALDRSARTSEKIKQTLMKINSELDSRDKALSQVCNEPSGGVDK